MGLNTQKQESKDKVSIPVRLLRTTSNEGRILIICDDDAITERLNIAFREAGFISVCARSMTEGCRYAKSGGFQVVFTVPVLQDGSWRRLADIASQYDLGFVVVLVTRGFDFHQYSTALEEGVFDVVDALHDLPQAADAARGALWAAYLKGTGPSPDLISHTLAA